MSRDLVLLRKAFITYIRPLLEYNTVIWNPNLIKHIDMIENVQRRFTKRIPQLSHLTYYERLAVIDLEPLELRRLRCDLNEYYKILNNLSPIPWSQYFTFYQPISSTRSGPRLQKPVKGSAKFFNSFFNRSIDCWNSLPSDIRESRSLSVFKKAITKFDLSVFTIGHS